MPLNPPSPHPSHQATALQLAPDQRPIHRSAGEISGLEPDGAFLKDSSAWIAELLGPLADQTTKDDWAALGSYSVRHPSLKHGRLIALNSVYFSPRYHNACSPGKTDPATKEMQWLASKLAQAERRKERVWLIFHIPPGIDGYASYHGSAAGKAGDAVPMWKPLYTEQFERLLERYRKTVVISLAGHEHTDDFRLIGGSLVLMTPGLSPLVGQNPAFRNVAFRSDGTVANETTYYLSNLDAASRGNPPDWKREYDFGETWRVRELNFQTITKIDREIATNPAARNRWSTVYSVSRPEGKMITPQTFPWLFCVTSHLGEAPFHACVEQIQKEQRE